MRASAYLLVFGSTAVLAVTNATSVFMTNPTTTKLVEFSKSKPTCQVHTDRETIDAVLELYPSRVKTIGDEALERIIIPCSTRKHYGFIYPGTLWCGEGTKATNYSQLGVHETEDKCCRDHDNCGNYLLAGECKAGICNDSPYTRSHCDCDIKFQECLRNAKSESANTIGAIFFNVAKIICFEETECKETEKLQLEKEGGTTCPYKFVTAAKYTPSEAVFNFRQKKAYYLNIFLKKIRLLR